MSDTDNNHVPGDGQRQGECGACRNATMPNRESCNQRDCDRDPRLPLEVHVPRVVIHSGATKEDCARQPQGDQTPGEVVEHSASGSANVRVRVRVSKTNNDMAQPSRMKPRSLTKHCQYCKNNTQHPMRIVRRSDQDKRPAAQLEGFTQEASRSRIAPRLAQDWADAMKAKRKV